MSSSATTSATSASPENADQNSAERKRTRALKSDDHTAPPKKKMKSASQKIKKKYDKLNEWCRELLVHYPKANAMRPGYNFEELCTAKKILKEMEKKLRKIKRHEVCKADSDNRDFRDLPAVKKYESKIIQMCKNFKEKYGKPFPICLSTDDWDDEEDDTVDTDYLENVNNLSNYDDQFHEEDNGVIRNEIGIVAYITMVMERIKEVIKNKYKTEFKKLSVTDKVRCIVEAHNDFNHAYVWAGYAKPFLQLVENRKNDPVMKISLPFQWIDVCIGDYLCSRLNDEMNDDYVSCYYYYYESDNCDFPRQMLIGWKNEWFGRNKKEYATRDLILTLDSDDEESDSDSSACPLSCL